MDTVQIPFDTQLLHAADEAAKKQNIDRATFIQQAVADHLKALEHREEEERHRLAYLKYPVTQEELDDLKAAAAWMDEGAATSTSAFSDHRISGAQPSSSLLNIASLT